MRDGIETRPGGIPLSFTVDVAFSLLCTPHTFKPSLQSEATPTIVAKSKGKVVSGLVSGKLSGRPSLDDSSPTGRRSRSPAPLM